MGFRSFVSALILARPVASWTVNRGVRAFHRGPRVQFAVGQISVADLKALFDGGDVPGTYSVLNMESCQFIDCREPDELMVANYPTPGLEGDRPMLNLPLSTMEDWSAKLLDGSLLDKDKPVVVACKVGGRSGQLCGWLDQAGGFNEVYNLAGGINQYSAKIDSAVGGPY